MFLNSCHCDWCNKEISEYNLEGTEKAETNKIVHFCNFVCAKHYNDLINKVYLDINNYNELFKNNKLDITSAKIFIKISKNGFEFMPRVNLKQLPSAYKDRVKMCRKYLKDIYEM